MIANYFLVSYETICANYKHVLELSSMYLSDSFIVDNDGESVYSNKGYCLDSG